MVSLTDFNSIKPTIMHIDLNSCFASVEAQANPLLRHKPLAVVHTLAPYGCILSPSVEAKLWGVKTGMTLSEGLERCPFLLARSADPPKYRQIHGKIGELLNEFSPNVISKSIDEFCLTLYGNHKQDQVDIETVSRLIKSRIKKEIGDYLRVSIGVSTNQNLAKLASGLHKPDGFDVIDQSNFLKIYKSITLTDFCGINIRNEARLHRVGIFSPLAFYNSSLETLRAAFGTALARYWYSRLRGYEVDDIEFSRRSFGQSYVLPHPMTFKEWRPILAKLVAKAGRRLRSHDFFASATHLYLRYSDHSSWHTGHKLNSPLFNDSDLLASALALNPPITKKVKKLAVTFFGLNQDNHQLSCLRDLSKDRDLTLALDSLNNRYGEYVVKYGSFLGSKGHVRDAIAFGK